MEARLQRKAVYACVRAICAALALFASFFLSVGAQAEADGMLRVKLARLGAPSEITLRADCDYHMADEPSLRIASGTDATLSAEGDHLVLAVEGRSLALGNSVRLMRDGSGTQGLTFVSPALSNRFCGDLYLAASGGVITGVLRIYVEDYLYGAVGCEMAPSSGLEALKAQAIVARNCALRQKSARGGSGYDLSDSGEALSFRGYNAAAEYADAIRAVDETRGQVLCFDDCPAICYFCDSNGGQTESSANAFGESLPYSVVMDDPYDFAGAGVKKTASLRRDATDLAPRLRETLFKGVAEQLSKQGLGVDPSDIAITAIEDIACASPRFAEPSRLYRALDFMLSVSVRNGSGETSEARMTVRVPTYGGVEDWYDLDINDADNETVWVSHTDRAFEIAFRRSGDGVGMSRRGAQAMAKKGLSCETILDYYYPGTQIRTVELRDSAQDAASSGIGSAQPIASARLSQKSRLYESPDNASPSLNTLPAGATVEVYAVRGEWAAVGSGDLYGYTHAEALTSFALVGVTAAQVRNETFAQISAGPVEVLQLPVETATALETLAGGAPVRLNAYTDAWALVTTASGVEGFIPRSALTLQADDPEARTGRIVAAQDDLYGLLTEDAGLYVNADDSIVPGSTLEKGRYVRILAYNNVWAYVRTADDRSGYVKLNCLSAVRHTPPRQDKSTGDGGITVVEGERFLYVAADALTLYRSHSEDSEVLATLNRGDRVQLGAYNQRWACVRIDGVTGYALLSGLTETAPEGAADDGPGPDGGEITFVKGELYASVIPDDAPLYPSRSDGDEPIARLKAGTRVRVGAYNSLWACVRVDGVTGFMRVEALELIAESE